LGGSFCGQEHKVVFAKGIALASRSKTRINVYLAISLLCCVLGTILSVRYQRNTACFNDSPPLRSFVVTVGSHQERWLIKPSKEFAEKNGFKFDISYHDQHGRDYLIDLRRKDVEVVISNNITGLDKFDVDFYNYDCIHPTVASDLDDLVSDLKSSLKESIPNVTITEEK
jgi:hypothetical protein